MGADHVSAESLAEARLGAATISPVATGPKRGGSEHGTIGGPALGSTGGLHVDLPGRGANRIPAGSAKDVRINIGIKNV